MSDAPVGPKRVFLEDLGEEDLRLLARAIECGLEKTGTQLLQEVASGELELYRLPGGLLGMKVFPTLVWVELLVGQGLLRQIAGLRSWFESYNRPVETCASSPGLVRTYERAGCKVLGTWMRMI